MVIKTSIKRFVPAEVQSKVKSLLWKGFSDGPEKVKPYEFWIDIVSGCNLRCTACPVGMPEYTNSIGQQLTEMILIFLIRFASRPKLIPVVIAGLDFIIGQNLPSIPS
jgi:hypothetical protein